MEKENKKRERKSDDKEKEISKPVIKASEDVDDFIFEGERYKCSER